MDISTALNHRDYRFPAGIIAPRVWLYCRFCLSIRDVQEMMLERGAEVSHEGILSVDGEVWRRVYIPDLQRDVDHFADARHTEGSVRPIADSRGKQMDGSKADNPMSYECSIEAISNLSGPASDVCATVQTERSDAIKLAAQVALVKGSRHKALSMGFIAFVLSDRGQKILARYSFDKP